MKTLERIGVAMCAACAMTAIIALLVYGAVWIVHAFGGIALFLLIVFIVLCIQVYPFVEE